MIICWWCHEAILRVSGPRKVNWLLRLFGVVAADGRSYGQNAFLHFECIDALEGYVAACHARRLGHTSGTPLLEPPRKRGVWERLS